MISMRSGKSILSLAVLALGLAVPAWAHGVAGLGSAARPSGLRELYAPGLLGQLLYPCQADCAAAAETCADGANSDALSCISSDCPTEIKTAQTACATSRSSSDCRTAVTALVQCADSCLTARSPAIATCHGTLNDCRSACQSAQ